MTMENAANQLVISTKRLLSTIYGQTVEEANNRKFFTCFSIAIRNVILPLWRATEGTYREEESKQLFYISMEYLMGRALGNNITNLKLHDAVSMALKKLGKDLDELEAEEREAGLGSGGLGRLASCFLDSLATLNLPGHGYGLRFRFGIFAQEIRNGYQVERPDRWLSGLNPWEIKKAEETVTVEFGGEVITKMDENGNSKEVLINQEKVRAVPFDTPVVGYSKDSKTTVNTLRLWSAEEEPHNFGLIAYNQGEFHKAFKNNTITYVLYPDDRHPEGKALRLKQQFFLVSASLQDILRKFKAQYDNFDLLPEKIAVQINDTHPTLVIPELMRILTQEEGIIWNKAWELTRKTCAYTNHTLMPEALEKWNIDLFKTLLPRQFDIIGRINRIFKAEIRATFPNDEEKVQRMSILNDGVVKMAHLATYGTHKINGVAKLHSELLKSMTLKDFHDIIPDHFTNVTNGITPRRWLLKANPRLAELVTSKIGDGWITDLMELRKLGEFSTDEGFVNEFLKIKHENKEKLAKFIHDNNPVKDANGNELYKVDVNPESLFDVQIKRLHEYKRQLLNILHVMKLCNDIKDNPNADFQPRTVIFGAKAAAAYTMAKNIIKLINCVARRIKEDPDLNKKLQVVYIENYNVAKAEYLFPAADLSEQISTASMEASGTGNMKFSLNGAMTIGTADGANVEMKEQIGPENWPFTFGLSSDEVIDHIKHGTYNPREVYESNETIKRVLNQLIDGTYAQSDDESAVFHQIFKNILDGLGGGTPDYFFVLKDFEDYVNTQKKVSELYKNRKEWARLAIMNMAGIGFFSTDVSINNYAEKIWNLKPTKVKDNILEKMKAEYKHSY